MIKAYIFRFYYNYQVFIHEKLKAVAGEKLCHDNVSN